MSRIIVKNLPTGTTEDSLRQLFGSLGHVTDCHLKFTKDGGFRKFAFVGFEKEDVVEEAVKRFNNSFLKTSQIKVGAAYGFGDSSKPRAWSKYSTESSAHKQKKQQEVGGAKTSDVITDKKTKKKKKAEITDAMLADVKDDPEFQEFLDIHQARSNKSSWGNDVTSSQSRGDVADLGYQSDERKQRLLDKTGHQSSASEEEEDEEDEESDQVPEVQQERDMYKTDSEFLKAKKSTAAQVFSDSDSDDSSSDKDSDKKSASSEEGSGKSSDSESDKNEDGTKESQPMKRYIIRMKGLQGNVKESMIKDFFKPLKLKSVKIPHGKKNFCIVTVEFGSESDLEAGMRRNKNFIGPKRVFLHKCIQIEREQGLSDNKQRSWEMKPASNEETESIAESGRLYVRNLAYICKEEDLQELFTPFGPLSELHLPIDSVTKKIKAFAFVTYMMPEHAVKAFTQLDGQIFKGRILHILPAEPKREEQIDTENLSFKQKQELERKKNAASSHNWNSLFLGANAVADVMASKYRTSKNQILSSDQKQSLGVRMALGETQIVSETREFLLENGVLLDAFSQSGGPRSKTLILVKNLPAGTQASQLQEVFEKHGQLGRVILPPSGVTALIEFTEVTEAKAAFRNLAYTKFGSVPLYLEWAPEGSLKETPAPSSTTEGGGNASESEEDNKAQAMADEEAEETSSDSDTVLFVKNLNFDTTEESLRKHFAQSGKLHSATISKKKDTKKTGQLLSMGYGFVQYKKKSSADKALKKLQLSALDGHQLELKRSNRNVIESKHMSRKGQKVKKQPSSKILVRNVPFEAKVQEIRELFSVFGELKTVRLPKKLSGTGSHRGFAFVDFLTKQDAKRAFEALCHSTHLYGRRMVLEWADEEETLEELRKKTAKHYHDEPVKKKLKKSELMEDLNAKSSL